MIDLDKFISGSFRRWFRVFAYAAAVLFIFLLLYSGWKNRETILPFIYQADYTQLVGFVALYFVSHSASVAGWLAIIYTFDHQLDWWTHTQIYSMTQATRRLPGTLWYVGSRVVIYQQLGLNKTSILLANIIELLVLLVTASTIGLIFLLTYNVALSAKTILAVIAGLVMAAVVLHPSVFNWLLKKFGAPQLSDISFRRIGLWALLYSFMWITSGLMLNQLVGVFKSGAIDQTIFVIGAWTLSTTAGMLTFFLPTNFGVTELALTALLSPILPLPLAGAAANLMRFLTTLLEVGVSVVFYLTSLASPRLAVILNSRQSHDDQQTTH
jgi:uncharacterized membrane protein YbhN (UPF0104 family)